MKFIENKIPWITAILIFSLASISVWVTGTNNDWHHMLIAKISFFVWITCSAIMVYGLDWKIGKPMTAKDGEDLKYLDKPILLIFLAISSFGLMVKVMIIN